MPRWITFLLAAAVIAAVVLLVLPAAGAPPVLSIICWVIAALFAAIAIVDVLLATRGPR